MFLADLWPSPEEIRRVIGSIDPEVFRSTYSVVFEKKMTAGGRCPFGGDRYDWDSTSTYIAKPPFSKASPRPFPVTDIDGARVLALLGDSGATDHLAGRLQTATSSPADQWLQAHGVAPLEFNSYGSRRGHHG